MLKIGNFQYSLFHYTIFLFFEKIISLEFEHLFLELFFANPTLQLQYSELLMAVGNLLMR